MPTRWTVNDTTSIHDENGRHIATINGYGWTWQQNAEHAESIVREHNAHEVAYDFVYRVANGLLTADVKRAAQSVLKEMEV